MSALFIFGYGYTAAAVAKALLPAGWKIAATSRNPVRRAEMRRLGITALDFAEIGNWPALADYPYILSTISPGKQGDPVLLTASESIFTTPHRWIGHLSTTGVYGDHKGGWVDEDTPVQPMNPRLQRRIETESAWLRNGRRRGQPVHIFRLAGIYGPGRNALQKLMDGQVEQVVKPGHYFSRTHVDDIAQALVASMQAPNAGRIYNICDDEPCESHVVTRYAAGLLGISPPRPIAFEQAKLSEMAREFYAANKRVSNRRVTGELNVSWRYPTYREGLSALSLNRHGTSLATTMA